MPMESARSAEKDMDNVEQLIRKYSQMLYRICLVMLCSKCDAEDAVQETFLRYMTKGPDTREEDYQKAWLIRVAVNTCKNMRLFSSRHNHLDIACFENQGVSQQYTDIFAEVAQLPAKYRVVMLLHYAQGYRTEEIARFLKISPAAVRKRLQLGREKLKFELGKE